jgi:NADPH:quinone reductase-like Zn-dependent oxidoreductase
VSASALMSAVVQHSFGAPGVLTLGQAARPVPLPTEVLVRVRAAGVNPVDWQTRAGAGVAWALGELPFTLGWDVSGIVEEVGFGVTTLAPGEEVYGMPWFPRAAGGYAEFVTAPSRQFARKPRSITHEQAAAVPLAALTAWQTLIDTAHVQPGQRVLVHAAAGGVGHFAVQIARYLGAHVIGTASSARHDWLTKLGADQVIDHTTVAFDDVLADVDVVLDLVGDARANTSTRSLTVLRPGGLIIAVPGGVSPELAVAADAAGVRATPFLVEPDGTALTRIAELIDAGTIRVEVEDVYPLADVARAHTRGQSNRTRGKLVLHVAS